MSTATPADVRGLISTDASDSDIQNFLDDAQYENQQVNDVSALTTEDKKQIEKRLAALKIREIYDRSIKQASRESAQMTYEGPSLAALRRMVDQVDPSGKLAYNRDTDRHVTST